MTNASDHDILVADRARLATLKVAELQALAAQIGLGGAAKLRKGELVEAIAAHQAAQAGDAAPAAEAPVVEAAPAETPVVETAPAETAPADEPAAPAVAETPADERPAGSEE
ncbi:Rho termination factor N-terminal domain-containing protein, partial [Agromyces seonyuensis]|uniref:Rho termination factor N-terminal domain-containing protein n=1 Tax=Agromyces seonyuensis TaxID=2662446 RepID=UPI0030150081